MRVYEGIRAEWDFTPGRKTKMSHPYSYDPILQHCAAGKANGTVYTDRLLSWDWEKHDRLAQKHFGATGHYWHSRSAKQIEAFLRDWLEDQELRLIAVIEYCNVATGYPTWRLDYRRAEPKARGALATDASTVNGEATPASSEPDEQTSSGESR